MPSHKNAPNPKGRRYSIKERSEMLAYLESVNAERGRGGQTAAAKKFGISPLTLSKWKNASPSGSRSSGKPWVSNTLAKLATLHAQIVAKEGELAKWRQEFNRIKNSI
jgi:hypothetical protein